MSDPNPKPMHGVPCGPWHDWFAWYPTYTYDQRLVWFRWVRRRCIQAKDYVKGPSFWWQIHKDQP